MTRESSRTPHSQVRHSDLGRLQSKAAAIEIPDVNVIIGIRSVGGFPPRVAEESDAIQRVPLGSAAVPGFGLLGLLRFSCAATEQDRAVRSPLRASGPSHEAKMKRPFTESSERP